MNRKERRKANKSLNKSFALPKSSAKMYLGEELIKIRTTCVRAAYKQWMDIYLLSIHDEDAFEYNSFPNHMGKLNRLERAVRNKVNSYEDIADFNLFIELTAKVRDVTGLQIKLGDIDRTCLNTKSMISKKFSYTPKMLNDMKMNCALAAMGIYFAIFILEVHRMTGFVSLESGDSPLDKLTDRIFSNNIDSLNDKYAQLEFSDFDWALKEYCNGFTTPGLD